MKRHASSLRAECPRPIRYVGSVSDEHQNLLQKRLILVLGCSDELDTPCPASRLNQNLLTDYLVTGRKQGPPIQYK